MMNVLLIKRGDHLEIFEIEGDGVTLVGEFARRHAGYDEEWSVLVGKTIALSPKGATFANPSPPC